MSGVTAAVNVRDIWLETSGRKRSFSISTGSDLLIDSLIPLIICDPSAALTSFRVKFSRAGRTVLCISFLMVVSSTRVADLVSSDVNVLVRRSWKSSLYLRSASKDCSNRYSATRENNNNNSNFLGGQLLNPAIQEVFKTYDVL